MAGVDEHGRPEPARRPARPRPSWASWSSTARRWRGSARGSTRTACGPGSLVARALAERGLDGLAARAWSDGRAPNLRWILVHLVEEYSRHNGHADLLRESVDGLTGE
jgi:uncharacterized protein DUF664